MITDPRFAPRRSDVPYLRHRSLPKAGAAGAAKPPRAPVGAASDKAHDPGPDTAVAEFFSGQRAPREHSVPPPAAIARASASAPAAAPTLAAVVSSSLDLDAATSQGPPAAAAAAPATSAIPSPSVARVSAGEHVILSLKAPTVSLTRVQTGTGTLTIEAACSAEVGDLRLGCAYQLRSGQSSTVQASGGSRLAPTRSRRPVLVGSHERYERILVDLRQCRQIERLAVYAFSETRVHLDWGGTLIVTTFAGARVEVPLERLPAGEVAMLLSVYNVAGEFMIRAEMETIPGYVREACRAYGYDQITWLDDRSPVD